jgi:hypothetical protein
MNSFGLTQRPVRMMSLGKRDAAELGGPDDLAKRQMGEAGLNGGTSCYPPALRRGPCARAVTPPRSLKSASEMVVARVCRSKRLGRGGQHRRPGAYSA